MGETTGIQWTDRTWNPWYGCSKVSPGCAHCYMFREAKQYGRDPEAVTRSKTKFTEPLRWKEPAKVFTCSWSDWFHEAADEWRDDAWDIIRQTPHLTYQILTKRPERIAAHLPVDWGSGGYPNVWLGVSAEYQRQAAERLPFLLDVPASMRFVSAEPLLGPLDLTPWLSRNAGWGVNHGFSDRLGIRGRLHWVIVGGESGGKEARRLNLNWVSQLIDDCHRAGCAVFVKQLGSVLAREMRLRDWHGGALEEWPTGFGVREFPEVPS